MSFDISLNDSVSGEEIEFDSPHQMKGGIYAVGGSCHASLNVTYNYSPIFYRVLGFSNGIRGLDKMFAADSIPILQQAANSLKDDIDSDYWKPTEGNAKRALIQLLTMAKMRPDGIWRVR